jgi:hypothetical protein
MGAFSRTLRQVGMFLIHIPRHRPDISVINQLAINVAWHAILYQLINASKPGKAMGLIRLSA